jgi:hypothetical protein
VQYVTQDPHCQEYHTVKGDILYHSILPDQLKEHYRGDVQYCPEDDVHFPTLSVAQTLDFTAKARIPRQRAGKSRLEFSNLVITILTTPAACPFAVPIYDAKHDDYLSRCTPSLNLDFYLFSLCVKCLYIEICSFH